MFATARIMGATKGINDTVFMPAPVVSNKQITTITQGLVVELPFKVIQNATFTSQRQKPSQHIDAKMSPQDRALRLLRGQTGISFGAKEQIYQVSADGLINKAKIIQSEQAFELNTPQILTTPPPSTSDNFISDIVQILTDIETEPDPVRQAAFIAQNSSLLGYPTATISDPSPDGLYRYLKVDQDQKEHSILNLTRAAMQLVSVLFCSPFREAPKIDQFRTEFDYQVEKNELEIKARKYTLGKWFEHYLLQKISGLSESHQVVYNILLNRYSQASQILQKNGYQKLALIVSSGQKNVQKGFKDLQGKLDVNIILKALEGNVEDLSRTNLFNNWLELLAVCICQAKTVSEGLERSSKLFKQEPTHFLYMLIKLYGQARKLDIEYVNKISFNCPTMCGFLLCQIFKRFYQQGNAKDKIFFESLQNRICCQLIHETQSKYFRQFYSGSTKWFHRVFGAEFEDASGNNKIQEYLGKRQLQQQDDVEGAFRIDVMEFAE
ncbi:Conserved_hypothetical protein [Hexamita inflata]|uniref:Uncharacterized protein n=2 Tax=Hexamita inflata TaxID=28002 RepID=A0AA86N700_9EUKA|nr:Conserved hypothetical protein [Hexamita inflata]CAI9927636.1 Conserved hypothetical protein [Hexamita inflata]